VTTRDVPDFLDLQSALAGRYSIERELGRGGMGIVYLAHEVALDRPVALKLLPPAFAAQPAMRERFLREARTAAKLSHPNIVPIFAVDEVQDFVLFAMAYVDGETLGDRLRARGPLPVAEATRVLREVAWALAYAHAQGVVHRDVKPDNILLESSGRAMVTDFGIAHVHASGLTEVGEVLGTAEYMSPEQASGEQVDARSDLYALGVVGYYAMAGRLPFEGETIAAILAKHLTQPAPPLASVAPSIPKKLARAIDRCLMKEPSERFDNGERLADALGETAPAVREIPVALRVFIKQNREAHNAGAFAVLALIMTPGLIGGAIAGSALAGALAVGLISATALGPFVYLASRARKLLKTGYTPADALHAFKQDVDKRVEELTFEFGGTKTGLEAVAAKLTYGSFGVGATAVAAIALAPNAQWLWAVCGVSFGTFIVAGAITTSRRQHRLDIWGTRLMKFWNSRVGGWLFKAAGIGLAPVAPSSEATYRPTELAIGLAADHLFKALPKAARQSLADLPAVVRRLESDAQTMRKRVEELDTIITDLAADDRRAGAEERRQLKDDLAAQRDTAQIRMTEAVAALERVRLDLLRMQAGAGGVESVTTNLNAARDLSDDIERLLEGRAEVEKMLGGGRPETR